MGRLCFRTAQDFGVRTDFFRCGMACFLPSLSLRSFSEGGPGTNFIELYAFRACLTGAARQGTSLIGAANLSQVTNLVVGTGAVVSRRSEAESGVAPKALTEAQHASGVQRF